MSAFETRLCGCVFAENELVKPCKTCLNYEWNQNDKYWCDCGKHFTDKLWDVTRKCCVECTQRIHDEEERAAAAALREEIELNDAVEAAAEAADDAEGGGLV